jgi:hypothetical protein
LELLHSFVHFLGEGYKRICKSPGLGFENLVGGGYAVFAQAGGGPVICARLSAWEKLAWGFGI